MLSLSTAVILCAFVLGSMTYVYRFRGEVQYAGLSEYLRKSWPIFAPMNCLLYCFTQRRARHAIMDLAQYPELAPLQANWQRIRDEALALYASDGFETASGQSSGGYYDVGFRTFHKYGWRKFYLRWYGHAHASAQRLCPETSRLLASVPGINGAMFSLLPAGSQLTRHSDPVACSLRYHLGLSTPNDDRCFINVDDRVHSWRDGEALLFDETYLHFARNDTGTPRIILMCDVERPTLLPGRWVNALYKRFMAMTLVPNMPGDRRGLFNRVYAGLAPLLARSRTLKQTHPMRYKALKYSVNSVLVMLALGVLVGGVSLLIAGVQLLA